MNANAVAILVWVFQFIRSVNPATRAGTDKKFGNSSMSDFILARAENRETGEYTGNFFISGKDPDGLQIASGMSKKPRESGFKADGTQWVNPASDTFSATVEAFLRRVNIVGGAELPKPVMPTDGDWSLVSLWVNAVSAIYGGSRDAMFGNEELDIFGIIPAIEKALDAGLIEGEIDTERVELILDNAEGIQCNKSIPRNEFGKTYCKFPEEDLEKAKTNQVGFGNLLDPVEKAPADAEEGADAEEEAPAEVGAEGAF